MADPVLITLDQGPLWLQDDFDHLLRQHNADWCLVQTGQTKPGDKGGQSALLQGDAVSAAHLSDTGDTGPKVVRAAGLAPVAVNAHGAPERSTAPDTPGVLFRLDLDRKRLRLTDATNENRNDGANPISLTLPLPTRAEDLFRLIDEALALRKSDQTAAPPGFRSWLRAQRPSPFTRQEQTLLCVLAPHGKAGLARSQVALAIWGETACNLDPQGIAHRLRVLVSRIRGKMMSGPFAVIPFSEKSTAETPEGKPGGKPVRNPNGEGNRQMRSRPDPNVVRLRLAQRDPRHPPSFRQNEDKPNVTNVTVRRGALPR